MLGLHKCMYITNLAATHYRLPKHGFRRKQSVQAEDQQRLADSGFQLYETLNPMGRAELVHSATQYVSAWLTKPLVGSQGQHSLQPANHREASPTLPMPQHQLLERQPLQATASTSQSQHSQRAVPTPSVANAASKPHSSPAEHVHASSTPAISIPQQHSNNSTESPLAVPAPESSRHTQSFSPALSTATNILKDQDTAAALSAVEDAQQHQPLDDNKVLGDEPAAPRGSTSLAQTTASALSDTPHQAQEVKEATGSDLPLQRLSLEKEFRSMPEALEANSNSSSGLSQSHDGATHSTAGVLFSSTDDVSSGSEEPEGKVQKAVKAETLAFQASFAQAAAADKVDRPAGADFATAGQRTETWHAMRQGRLTASAFANALGYGLISSSADRCQVLILGSLSRC